MQLCNFSWLLLMGLIGFGCAVSKVSNIAPIRLKRSSISIPDISEIFPAAKNDKTKIRWAHSVVSRAMLQKALNGDIDMLETDVLFGTLYGEEESGKPLLIAAHPPAKSSDLSLEEFLDTVFAFTKRPKGIKLDFKMLDAVEPALAMLKAREKLIKVPIWLNADIIQGPVDDTSNPIDASTFLHLCQKYFPSAVLSLGWTTRFGPEPTNPYKIISEGSYSQAHVEAMQAALMAANISQKITFPVRAGIAASSESHKTLKWLLDKVPDSTLTIWSSIYDPVDDISLVKLLDTVGRDRIYLDVPKGLKCLVDSEGTSAASVIKAWPVALFLAAMMTFF